MDVTEVRVEYGRTLTDGDYGSERASVVLSATKADGERVVEVVGDLGALARELVNGQLAQARSSYVRRTVAREEGQQPEGEP